MVNVRLVTPADAAGLLEIYAPHVLHSACTFETEVPSVAAFRDRILAFGHKFPWIVAEVDGLLAGYVYASTHREREAYRWTCECSVYVHPRFQGKRLAQTLYDVLFRLLALQGLVNVYAGITLPNPASVALHERCGFSPFAVYDNIGYKLGAWHKVGWWKQRLNEYLPLPAPPLLLSEINPSVVAGLLEQAARRMEAKLRD